MNFQEINSEIQRIKSIYKERIFIPGHHYQSEDIIRYCDFVGDSYKLAVESSGNKSEFVIFCGVKFMGESAKVLVDDDQKVILPRTDALCPMAEMINEDQISKAYEKIRKITGKKVAPVVYMNSNIDTKSFCGLNEGAVVTSSNALKIIKYYLDKDYVVFFSPDYHLGRNTASKLGIDPMKIAKVDSTFTVYCEGNKSEAQIFLWDGFCHVHQEFTLDHVKTIRKRFNDIKITVHPESKIEVVEASDHSGSTSEILRVVEDSPSGSSWAVGTELNFVQRLAHENPDKLIVPLHPSECYNMQLIKPVDLLNALKSVELFINSGDALDNEVTVEPRLVEGARKSMEKMIDIVQN